MSALQRFKSLQHEIDRLHLLYLETDESPRKIEQRKKLEGYIREYLYLVPHDRKFCFEETKHVLRRSVECKENFSAYKASNAWSALAVYAENLLAQPWRKEFRQVKLYSGYYKHEIESGLVGAEIMLEKMGYKHSSQDVSMVLDTVTNTARIVDISKDCLVAMVECQILRTVYEEVIKKCHCSWLQVLDYREAFVSSPEILSDAIINKTLPKIFSQQTANHTMCPHSTSYKPVSFHDCMYNNYPPNPYYPYLSMQPPMSTYTQPYCQGNVPLKPPFMCPPYSQYNYSYSAPNHGALPQNYTHPVPTGQLIEIDPPQESYYCHRRSNSDHKISHQRKSSERYSTDSCSRSTPSDDLPTQGSKTKSSNCVKIDGSVSSEWDFIDPSDIRNSKAQVAAKSKSNYSSSSLDNLKINGSLVSEDSKLSDTLGKLSVCGSSRLKAYESQDSTDSSQRMSAYDNQSGFPASNYQSLHSPSKSKTLVTESGKQPSKPTSSPNQTRSDNLLIDTSELVVNLNSSNEWSCANCTYLNKESAKICEICNKSRTSGNEMAPLISGGRECPKCTLVNEKDLSTCVACNSDLKDSSTYV
ncbi:unnamed protein product [Bemisia tabaci]|uniref:RanBP2-type domain-containing protein n=1 Tax=Bemisia tabaci TaxID=7038 RepID=A0A9P0AK49_BEMTA|nr:unnamed protein product [Bemisia tabaci]